MPLYDYRCDVCNIVREEVRGANEEIKFYCRKCGGLMYQTFTPPSVINDYKPYFDHGLNTYVKGKQHRKALMKKRGYEEAGDPSFIRKDKELLAECRDRKLTGT